MIGLLPKTVEFNDHEWNIRSDYRDILLIFQAYNDPELNDYEKTVITLQVFYKEWEEIPDNMYEEALNKAAWFMDGGEDISDNRKQGKKVVDWEQDEKIIFSAINKVAGKEVRNLEYMHWWTFLGYFNEIGDGLLSTVINIRSKKNSGKKLEKYEQEFYRKNKELINIKNKISNSDKKDLDEVLKILNG